MHELAHVRRYDHLVNLLQVVIETLLFYHPVVRWVSRVLREEREHCCDDLVVARSGDALAYARALTELASVQGLSLQTSVASDGGQLLTRIRRLVGVRRPPRVAAHWSIGVMLAAVAVSVSGLLQPLGVSSREADEPSAPVADAADPVVPEVSGSVFAQPRGVNPGPEAPATITRDEPRPVQPSGSAVPPNPALSQPTNQAAGVAPTGATIAPTPTPAAGPLLPESNLGDTAIESPDAVAAPDDAKSQPGTEQVVPTSPESVLVTAPSATGQLPSGSVVDRARMAAVDRVAQENGVKLVWLNPPVVREATGAPPQVGAESPDVTMKKEDSQARAIAILQPQPEFPDRARLNSIEGWVTVSYVIGRDGRVSNVAIVAAQPRNVFEGAVRKAVRSWRFEPVIVDGRPVEQEKTQTIRFSLSDVQPVGGEEECTASTGSRICRPAGH
jgi:TonB family protein